MRVWSSASINLLSAWHGRAGPARVDAPSL
jgi:hypothetical protein